MQKLIALFLFFSMQAHSLEAFVSYCQYKDSILGLMYPQKSNSSTYYLFELKEGRYIDLGSGDSGGDYFQSGIAANREEGETLMVRSEQLKSYFKGTGFKLISIPENHTEIKLVAKNVCNLQ
ncbi:hypothetical protein [Teredinibacter purpureus]|uniref:hypothetical protein n=1 Tax=Teredinibacter purpureus TaxID=2731756 RepID=UPI0005F7F1A8|nr:hypothetical protein [Teredinibacter purpureus]